MNIFNLQKNHRLFQLIIGIISLFWLITTTEWNSLNINTKTNCFIVFIDTSSMIGPHLMAILLLYEICVCLFDKFDSCNEYRNYCYKNNNLTFLLESKKINAHIQSKAVYDYVKLTRWFVSNLWNIEMENSNITPFMNIIQEKKQHLLLVKYSFLMTSTMKCSSSS